MLGSATNDNSGTTSSGRILSEILLNESIRYSPEDAVEQWLNNLLCLDATVVPKFSSGCPLPDTCDLYPFVEGRKTVFQRPSPSTMTIHITMQYSYAEIT